MVLRSIGCRFFYTKLLRKAGGGKTPGKVKSQGRAKWRVRGISLIMTATLIMQLLPVIPGVFANTVPTDENIWKYPEIEYNGRSIYDGIVIPVEAELNAKFEFMIGGGTSPTEVFLPDFLYAVAGEYSAAAFDIYGSVLPGAKVIIDDKSVIKVYFDAPEPIDDDNANDDGATTSDDEDADDGDSKSNDDDTGSSEHNEPDSDEKDSGSTNDSGYDSCENACENSCQCTDADSDRGSTDRGVSDGSGNETENGSGAESGSGGSQAETSPTDTEPPGSGSDSGSNNGSGSSSGSGSDAASDTGSSGGSDTGSSNGTGSSSGSDTGSGSGQGSGQDAEPSSEPGSGEDSIAASPNMFDNIGPLTAQAYDGGADAGHIPEYTIKFEIPCYFDVDMLPPMPEPIFNEETEEWETEAWTVDILNTVLKDGEYKGEFVTVELEQPEFEPFTSLFDFEILSGPEYITSGEKNYTATINWNDNNRESSRPDWESLTAGLTLYYQIPGIGMTEPVPLTEAILTGWGISPAAAANLINTPEPGRTALNYWSYIYENLPANLLEIDGYEEEEPFDPIVLNTFPITYSIKMPSATQSIIENNYIVEQTGPNDFRATLKEVFTITKEWKDSNNAFDTRVDWDELLENLGLSRSKIGETVPEGLGNLDELDDTAVYDGKGVTVLPRPESFESNTWTITIVGMPAFDVGGLPYHYFVVEDGGGLNVDSENNLSPKGNVRYEAVYENTGDYITNTERCYKNGVLVNRLTDEVEFDARKIWQDDDEDGERPDSGLLLLYRYPRVGTNSYRTSSPVSGMEVDVEIDGDFDIDFSELEIYPEGGLPRFDSEGQEYVYFVKELYAEGHSGVYLGIADYSDAIAKGMYVPPEALGTPGIPGILFNGGVLQNRRVDTADVTVTKTWFAAARQNMNAEVTVLVERRLKNAAHSDTFKPVDLSGYESYGDELSEARKKVLEDALVDGLYTLLGFRAEEREKSHAFSGLPQYDDEGREYEYRITEQIINIDGTIADDDDFVAIGPGRKRVVIDEYAYELDRSPATGIAGSGDVQLTNTLVGETEIRIEKIWNGGTPPGPATFYIQYRDEKGVLHDVFPSDAKKGITMEKDGSSESQTGFYINPEDAWQRSTPGGATINEGGWLVIAGLRRYDDFGREIEYVVRENPVADFYNRYDFKYGEDINSDGERYRKIDSTFTNTPATGSGRYVRVYKVWADDGDQGCRGPVTMVLYHNDPVVGWKEVGRTAPALSQSNDWTGFLRLNGQLETGVEDRDYNNYFVLEESVLRDIAYLVDYGDGSIADIIDALIEGLEDRDFAYGTNPVGELETNAHFYDVFVRSGTVKGSTLIPTPPAQPHPDDPAWVPGDDYRTSYTYRNVRKGDVEIDITKIWRDDRHHELDVPQQVEIKIFRSLNYGGAPAEVAEILLQWNSVTGLPSLHWNSVAAGLELPKYNENGVLYLYNVVETKVYEMTGHPQAGGTRKPGPEYQHDTTGGGYILHDRHRYSVSVSSEHNYGDHIPPDDPLGTELRPDVYTYKVTNQRHDTVDFIVYKLWHDVGRTLGEEGVDFNPDIEGHERNRPDIYLTLYSRLDEPGSVFTPVGPQYIKRIWSTTDRGGADFNDYYWMCRFDPLDRYNSMGVEIFYSVVEEMPNRAGSEYTITEYWDTDGITVMPVLASDLGHDLSLVTDIPIYAVPDDGVTNRTSEGRVHNGGIIVNRREAERTMTGQKVWRNIPNLSPDGFPTISVELFEQEDYEKDNFEKVDGFEAVPLPGGATEFRFEHEITGDETLPKYDEYGVFIMYRAKETPVIPGYEMPEYNDFLMEITNTYKLDGPEVRVAVRKSWIIDPYDHDEIMELEPEDRPVAKIELWRVMVNAAGVEIESTRLKVGELEIPYGDGDRHEFLPANLLAAGAPGVPPGVGLPSGEVGRLLKGGYNGRDYVYYLDEKMNGYVFEQGDNIPDLEVPATDFYFETENEYDGSSSTTGSSLVRLRGDKIWADDEENKYGLRPVTGPPNGSPAGSPSIELRVYRAEVLTEATSDTSEELSKRIDITDSVDIIWTLDLRTPPGNDLNLWHYYINAKPYKEPFDPESGDDEPEGQETIVGKPPATPGSTTALTLYRYSITGNRYVYYVEEVNGSHHYKIESARGTDVSAQGATDMTLRAAPSGNDMIASFRNRLNTVEVTVDKVWMKDSGLPGGLTAITPNEFTLMLPDSITFKVQYREGSVAGTVFTPSTLWADFKDGPNQSGAVVTTTLTKEELIEALGTGNSFEVKVDLLPKYGAVVSAVRQYRLIETHINGVEIDEYEGFTVTGNAEGSDEDEVTEEITNTLEVNLLKIIKIWEDNSDRDGVRPETGRITFRIERDGDDDVFMEVWFSSEPDTNEITRPVPKYKADGSGDLSTYTVEELVGSEEEDDARDYYDMSSPGNPNPRIDDYTLGDPSPAGEEMKEYEFTNSHTKYRINLTVTKDWEDSSVGLIGIGTGVTRPSPYEVTVTIEWSEDGTDESWKPMVAEDLEDGDLEEEFHPTVTLPYEGKWEYTWEGLLARHTHGEKYHYRVVETSINGYTATYRIGGSGDDFDKDIASVTEDDFITKGNVGIDIMNELDTVSLTVEKIWDDLTVAGNNPFAQKLEVVVQLQYRLATSGEDAWTDAPATTILKLNSTNNWTDTFEDLPKMNNAGTRYIYSVKEVSVGTEPVAPGKYLLSYDSEVGGNKAAVDEQDETVTNTLVPRHDITVTKVWDDNNNQDGIRPTSINIRLIKDMGEGDEEIFEEITLTKTSLSDDGTPWSHTFKNLPMYRADGSECTYHIQEVRVPGSRYDAPRYMVAGIDADFNIGITGTGGYTGGRVSTEIPDEDGAAVSIRNTHTPRVMGLTVIKSWPSADPYGVQPASIQLRLSRTTDPNLVDNIEVVGTQTVSASSLPNAWGHTWTGLDIMKNTGGGAVEPGTSFEYYYFVEELNTDGSPVKGYLQTYAYSLASDSAGAVDPGRSIIGSINDDPQKTHSATITNTIDTVSLTVNKIWTNLGSLFVADPADRPTVVVELWYRLGNTGDFAKSPVVPTPTATLSTGNGFSGTFSDLPRENYAGVRYQYTVREIKIGDATFNPTGTPPVFPYSYSSTVNDPTTAPLSGVSVTNTLETRGDITVTKNWQDGSNRDGIRPASVQIQLIRDIGTGEEFASELITLSGPTWSHTFENLPKFRQDGTTESTYHVLEVSVGSYSSAATPPQYQINSGGYGNAVQITAGAYTGDKYVGMWRSPAMPADTGTTVSVDLRNTYIPRVMGLTVTKQWSDYSNSYLTQPDSIRLQLRSSTSPTGATGWTNVGEPVSVSVTSLEAPWTHTWTDLPIRENTTGGPLPSNSVPLYYSVVELNAGSAGPVFGYTPTYSYTLDTGSTGTITAGASIAGSISDNPERTHTATVTNTLDTVDVTVKKIWDDHGDLYGLRYGSLTFTLERKPAGTPDSAFTPVTDGVSPITLNDIDFTGFGNEQEVKFENLPKFVPTGPSGTVWVYRVIETHADGNPVTPDISDPTKGIIGDENDAHYKFSSSTVPDSNGYTTTITNELVLETITISGTKTWEDGKNRYGFRPETLDLQVWYLDKSQTPNVWEMVNSDDYDIEWTKRETDDEFDDEWDYVISGFGLMKYEIGSHTLIEYCVREVDPLPGFTLYEVDYLYGCDDCEGSLGIRNPDSSGNIIDASFTNKVEGEVTRLWVSKEKEPGPDTYFNFEVYFSVYPITAANPGTLYTRHTYRVFDGGKYEDYENLPDPKDDALSGTITVDAQSDNEELRYIRIKAGQSFVLDLPRSLYFKVVELDHTDYVIDPAKSSAMSGQLGDTIEPVTVEVYNELLREITIINTTPNEGIDTPERNNAGGSVTVEMYDGQMPSHFERDEIRRDKLAVSWKPDLYWGFTNKITVHYKEFGPENGWKKLSISNFINPDGTLKALGDCDTDDRAGLERFLDDGAYLEFNNGALRLVLSTDLNKMPRSVLVEVGFTPTIAVSNVTENNAGGQVKVNCSIVGGSLSNVADGVPAFGGIPYPACEVYGVADEGYRIDMDYIVVRNMNDLDGEFVHINLHPDGTFTTDPLDTEIAGEDDRVVKSGTYEIASLRITFNSLPVPLQVDMRFIPIEQEDTPVTPDDTDDSSDTSKTAQMPKTGIQSILEILIFGLITSIAATAAVVIVIRRQSAKERKA